MSEDRHLPVILQQPSATAPSRGWHAETITHAVIVLVALGVATLIANALALNPQPWFILVITTPVATALALYNHGQHWKIAAGLFCLGIAGVIFTGPMADFELPMKASRIGFVAFLIAGGWLTTGSLYNALMFAGVMFCMFLLSVSI